MKRLARWRQAGFPKVEAPTEENQDLLPGHQVESLVERLKKKLPEYSQEEVWLEQLSALLKIAEEDNSSLYESLGATVKARLRSAKIDIRRMLIHVLWGFAWEVNNVDWGEFARELAGLTAVVLGRIKCGVDADSIYKDHSEALRNLTSLDDATTALSSSTEVDVGSNLIRTFISVDKGTASGSITRTEAIGK